MWRTVEIGIPNVRPSIDLDRKEVAKQTFHYDSAIAATQFTQLLQILVSKLANFLFLIQKQFDAVPRFVIHFQFLQSVCQCFDTGLRLAKQIRSTETE